MIRRNNILLTGTLLSVAISVLLVAFCAMRAYTQILNPPSGSVANRDQSGEAGPTKSSPGPAIDLPGALTHSASAMLSYVAIGLLLGVGGQGARVVVGLKAEMDKVGANGKWDWFDWRQFLVSLLLGGLAGMAYAIMLLGAPVDKQFLLGGIAAGYAGSDFIEGFMTRFLGASAPHPPNASQTGTNLPTPAPPQLPPLPVAGTAQAASQSPSPGTVTPGRIS